MTDARDDSPADILAFWREAGRDRWYRRDDAFDARSAPRAFSSCGRQAAAGELSSWEATDDGALALVIVLDQFPRNMFRGDALTYSSDALAREVARPRHRPRRRRADRPGACGNSSICRSCIRSICPTSCAASSCSAATGNAENLKYAEQHADIIRRFGRFPHRNRMLGRATTPEEQAFLDAGGFSG